jgi:hypothetical protein
LSSVLTFCYDEKRDTDLYTRLVLRFLGNLMLFHYESQNQVRLSGRLETTDAPHRNKRPYNGCIVFDWNLQTQTHVYSSGVNLLNKT